MARSGTTAKLLDDNTLKLLLAVVAAGQIVALAYFSRKQNRLGERVEAVHELVNGMSHEKDAAIAAAARKEGELAGRDWATPRTQAPLS